MSTLTLDGLGKSYGDNDVVRGVSVSIQEGEFVSVVGPSGCGKTTILRMIAGLIEPTRGRILMGSDDVTTLPPNKRNLGLVFQSYALFPHLTVFDNVAFGLRRRKVVGEALKVRVAEALDMVKLGNFGDRYPRQLSGGQQQRIAIARAIAPKPRVLLFDEPLSNLDAQLRDEMQIELKRLQRGLGITTLFVTHDQVEALSLADRVCVMSKGVMQQLASPEELYRRPATAFVAAFLGKPNRLRGTVLSRDGVAGVIAFPNGPTLPADFINAPAGASVDVVIRQEAIRIQAEGRAADDLDGTILLRSFAGARVQYVVKLASGIEIVADAPSADPTATLSPGSTVGVSIASSGVFAHVPENAAP